MYARIAFKHIRQEGVTHSAYGPFTKYCESTLPDWSWRIDAAYSDRKSLAKRIVLEFGR